MTAKRRTQKGKPFSISDNAIMGGYFNIARHNLFRTIVYIFDKTGIKTKTTEENLTEAIKSLKSQKLKVDQKEKLRKLLFNHFPVLGPIMAAEADHKVYKQKKSNVNDNDIVRGVNLDECIDVLTTLASCLSKCRNFYSHFEPYNSPEELKQMHQERDRVGIWLDKVMTAARRIDKDRESLTKEEMEFLTGIDHFFPEDTGEKDKKGRSIKKFVEHSDYYFRIRTTKPNMLINGKNNPEIVNSLSDFGIVFFCTLFLQKTYTKQMLDELELFEHGPYDGSVRGEEENDKKKNAILREMMCIYRLRTPRGRKIAGTNDNRVALALDMLNELRKCPRELYDVLGPEGKKDFEDEVKNENEHTPDKNLRLRYTDRFPHLVLRHIDENELFSQIRFQVHLGKFRFRFYDKTTINGDDELRVLQKDINGFGRLQDVERERKEKYKDLLQKADLESVKLEYEDLDLDLLQFQEDTADSTPYITDQHAVYCLNNNRIGLIWNDEEYRYLKDNTYLPELKCQDTANGPKPDILMPAPRASLSVRDFPAMMLYMYLHSQLFTKEKKDKQFPSVEAIIKTKYQAYRQLFKDIADGTLKPSEAADIDQELVNRGLKAADIPEKIYDYLTKEKGTSAKQKLIAHATRELNRRLRICERRLEDYDNAVKMVGTKDNKYGKKSYTDIRHGSIARYLAQSIIDWQGSNDNGRDKMTGLNFNKMQAALATFDHSDKLRVIQAMFDKSGLLSSATQHPFLSKVLDREPQNIERFYRSYLLEEINKLNEYIVKTEDEFTLKKNSEYTKLPFIHAERARWKQRDDNFYKQLAARYLTVDGKDATILLPDGLFTPYLHALLSKEYASNSEFITLINGERTANNASFLINAYLEHILNDKSQPYYYTNQPDSNTPGRYARIYDLFNILNNRKAGTTYIAVPKMVKDINRELTATQSGTSQKEILFRIENHLKKMEEDTEKQIKFRGLYGYKATKRREAGQEEREKMHRKLLHLLSDVKNNERAIRRYKTQDIILFLMAKQTLKNELNMTGGTNNDPFMLANVCEDRFLNRTLRFEFPITIEGRTVKIVQENLALKNYGEFYRFINDERVPQLLAQLENIDTISHADLTAELSNYDQRRSEVFRIMQQLESIAYESHKDILKDPDNEQFYFIDNNGKRSPIRNNFRSMLSLLEGISGNQLTQADREHLIAIRNAFGHNTYKIDIAQTDKNLPTIAIQIVNQINSLLGTDQKK